MTPTLADLKSREDLHFEAEDYNAGGEWDNCELYFAMSDHHNDNATATLIGCHLGDKLILTRDQMVLAWGETSICIYELSAEDRWHDRADEREENDRCAKADDENDLRRDERW
jgi:hypothetical protein